MRLFVIRVSIKLPVNAFVPLKISVKEDFLIEALITGL
jgi:hypothetical protein